MKKILYIIIFTSVFLGKDTIAQDKYDMLNYGAANLFYKKYSEAIQNFTEVLENSPNNIFALQNRAQCFLNSNQVEKAIEDLLIVNKLVANSVCYNLAICFSKIGNIKEAIEHLEQHLNSKYKKPKSFIRLDKNLNNVQNTKEWNILWEKDWYSKLELSIDEASNLFENNKTNEALDILDKILDNHKRNYKAYYLRAKVLSSLKQYKFAIEDMNKVIELKSKNANYYLDRAKLYSLQAKKKKAMEDINMAISLSPESVLLVFERAKIELKFKQYSNAKKDFENYLEYYHLDYEAIYNLGISNFHIEKYNEALDNFSEILSSDPSSTKSFIARANTYMQVKQFENAENDYSQALDLSPNEGKVYYNRGLARLNLKKDNDACSDWDKAIKLNYIDAIDLKRKYCQSVDLGDFER
ncbi:MAG: tetratricopeptide repeat protein [Bacteroidetes bacterium]|jgi:tetratricopeptide (TPR) repeat protein|nr:tetratricopeptide repeat protein [Bacteroidota bacterium]MBT6686853.1 tetratricopeptide repeat protein [Bacteroidota bacterium]MBT7144182.1 tetratricopeptide repeat protein [Bacteroidota bacterium]MBT7491901.1 tetratricopeptide repeat protein [Bacteroidota bacterium]